MIAENDSASAVETTTAHAPNVPAAGGDAAGGGSGAPAAPPRPEDLVDAEDLHSRGLAYQNAALEADELDDGADADVDDGQADAKAADEAPSSATDDEEAEEVGDAGDESDAGDTDDDAGEQRTVPEDAEERAEFLPDTADGYDLPAVEGHAWNPGGAALWQSLASSVLHGHDAPQGFLDAMGKWAVTEMPTVIQNAFKEQDREHNKSVRETLRGSWGDAYKNNLQETNGFFQSLPENVRGEIKAARLPDGRRLASSAAFLSALHETARKNSGRAPSVRDRLKALDEVMKTDRDRYFREGMSEERQALVERSEAGETTEAAHPDPLDRAIQATQSILRSDRERYFREGHDTRYMELLKEREARSKKPKRAA